MDFENFLGYFLRIGLLLIFLIVIEVQASFLNPAILANPSSKSFTSTNFMTSEEIRLVIQKAADSWINGDAEAFASLFTSEGEFIAPGHRWVGFELIKQAAREFQDSHNQVVIKIRHILIENNKAAIEWRWEDVNIITGERSQASDAIMVDFINGRIQRWREYIDRDSELG